MISKTINQEEILACFKHASQNTKTLLQASIELERSLLDIFRGLSAAEVKMLPSVFNCQSEAEDLLCTAAAKLVTAIEPRFYRDFGVVFTPFQLAREMVALASASSICTTTNNDERILTLNESMAGRATVYSGTWLDPAAGFGVFLIAIIDFYSKTSGGYDLEFLDKISAFEVNPVFALIARLRVTLYVIGTFGRSFDEIWSKTQALVKCSDFLKTRNVASQCSLLDPQATNSSYGIIIGNPPYVRAEKLSSDTKALLSARFPDVYQGKQDLFTYFLISSIDLLADRGRLCFITPASFQKNASSKKTREYLARYTSVLSLFDFGETAVFEDAGIHATVYVLAKENSEASCLYFPNLNSGSVSIKEKIAHAVSIPQNNFTGDGWIKSPSHSCSIEGIDTEPLVDYVGEIYSGIKTGCVNAYVLSEEYLQKLERKEEFFPYLKPLFVPKDLRPFVVDDSRHRLLFIPKDHSVREMAVLNYLEAFRESLSSRVDVKKHSTWYGLRECGYLDLFSRPKIIWPEISSECRFSIDYTGAYLLDGSFFIPREDYYLIGILNSAFAKDYFNSKCNSIGDPLERGRLRFKKTYIQNFPVITPSAKNRDIIVKIESIARLLSTGATDCGILELNKAVSELYRVPSAGKIQSTTNRVTKKGENEVFV